MTDLPRDPVINVIMLGIKHEIGVALDNGCLRAAVISTYAGIDAMAFLGMPAGQNEVQKKDFIDWAARYIRFPCKEQLTGEDMYGARCAMLHRYGSKSRMSEMGLCRQVAYMDKSVPEVRFNPAVSTELVLVSVSALCEALFSGVDRFIVDLYPNPDRGKLADKRFETLSHQLPRKEPNE
jgi:hypothetical protein